MSGNDMRKLMESLKPVNEMAGCGCGPHCKCGGDCGGHCGDANCPCECGHHTGVGTDEHGMSINESVGGLDKFCYAYLEAALWSSSDNSTEQGGDQLSRNYSIIDIAPETLAQMKADCASFQEQAWDDVSENVTQAGHDFWLTRNGHGAGFWDGDWPEPAATTLTNLSKKFGEFDLYVGDDGKIHGSPLAESLDEENVDEMAALMTRTATISFPQEVTAQDYHDFEYYKEILQKFGVKGVSYKETTDESGYTAVFNIRPNRGE